MEQNKKCWLVVWNREKKGVILLAEKLFAKVGDGKEKFSVWLDNRWPRIGDVKEGDKGVIVVKDDKKRTREVFATFTVTDAPEERENTHPEFWINGKNDVAMRILVRSDSFFPPVCVADIEVDRKDLGITPGEGHWVCEKPMRVYDEVRKRAESRE